jgi:hypothetical protein
MMLECGCPGEFPDWNNQDVELGGSCVLTLGIPMLLHMPLAYEAYLQRQQQEVDQLELPERWPGFVLTRTGALRGKMIRLLENVSSPSRHVSYLPKPFQLRAVLHQGDIGTIRTIVKEMQMKLFDEGKMPRELYLSYLTCPTCQEQRGGAKIMLLRHWVDSPRLKRRGSNSQPAP